MSSIVTTTQNRAKRKAPTSLPSEIITELVGPYMHHDCKEITANASRCGRAFRYSYQNAKADCSQYCVENADIWLPQLLMNNLNLFTTNTRYPKFEVRFDLTLTKEYEEESFQELAGYSLNEKAELFRLPITDVYLYFHKANGAYDRHSIYPFVSISTYPELIHPELIYIELARQLQLAASDSTNPLVALELEIHTYFLTRRDWEDWWDNAIDVGTVQRAQASAAVITVEALENTVFGLNKNWNFEVQSPEETNLVPWLQNRATFNSRIDVLR